MTQVIRTKLILNVLGTSGIPSFLGLLLAGVCPILISCPCRQPENQFGTDLDFPGVLDHRDFDWTINWQLCGRLAHCRQFTVALTLLMCNAKIPKWRKGAWRLVFSRARRNCPQAHETRIAINVGNAKQGCRLRVWIMWCFFWISLLSSLRTLW